MIDFRSGREPKSSSFDYIQIRIASPEEIRGPKDQKERERLALRDLERVIYYTNYVVIDAGEQEVQEKELLDEDRFLELRAKARAEGDTAFRADIGSPAVRSLLERLAVDKLADSLRETVATETSQHRKKQMLKRLKIVD